MSRIALVLAGGPEFRTKSKEGVLASECLSRHTPRWSRHMVAKAASLPPCPICVLAADNEAGHLM